MKSTSPIVFIHGIPGSHLAQTYDDSFDVVWSGVQKGFETIDDLMLDDAGEVDKDPWDLMTAMKTEHIAYGELLGRLRKEFHDVPVYIFRYDWRLDLRFTAQRFGQFLDLLSKKTGQSAFRVVTHSGGGLVLSAFLNLNKAANLKRIDRAVVAAPPFWGSVESMRVLVAGMTVWFGFHSSERFRKVSRTFPSIYQLVPGYPGAWDHPLPSADIWNIDYWQQRVKFGTRKKEVYEERTELMRRHLMRAREFQNRDLLDFDALPEDELKKFLLLYGKGETTLQKVVVRPTNSTGEIQYFFDFDAPGCASAEGDRTVPVVSARRYKKLRAIEIPLSAFSAWWPTLWDDKAKIAIAGFHSMLLALDKVQGLVIDWLGGRTPRPSWVVPIQP